MTAPDADPAAHFVAKWHRREPEMALAEVFCPPAQRARFRAWGAMVHELREAAFELSEVHVTEMKCQWWAEELLNLTRGAGRHPVSAELALPALPWPALARALLVQAHFDARPADAAEAVAQLRPFAEALSAVEAGVFEAPPTDPQAIAVHLLLQRLPAGLAAPDQARLPLNLLARHGLTVAQVAEGQGTALLSDWARELHAQLPARSTGSLFRRLRSRFDQVRLQRLEAGKGFNAPAPMLTVLRGWRVARRR